MIIDEPMYLFAIRHKPSGRFMPAIKGRGATGMNFHQDGYEHNFPRHKLRKEPRLFISKLCATRALSAWLKGEWKQETSGAGFFGEEIDVYAAPPDHPPADRNPDDMEVVMFELSEVKG